MGKKSHPDLQVISGQMSHCYCLGLTDMTPLAHIRNITIQKSPQDHCAVAIDYS